MQTGDCIQTTCISACHPLPRDASTHLYRFCEHQPNVTAILQLLHCSQAYCCTTASVCATTASVLRASVTKAVSSSCEPYIYQRSACLHVSKSARTAEREFSKHFPRAMSGSRRRAAYLHFAVTPAYSCTMRRRRTTPCSKLLCSIFLSRNVDADPRAKDGFARGCVQAIFLRHVHRR